MTFSITLMPGKSRLDWKVRITPSEAIRWEGNPVTSRPASETRPETGGKLPATRLKSVDLPAPLGPMMALIAPARHEKLTASIACRPPNQ